MARTTPKNSASYIMPLYMNGLQGRMLHLPSPSKRKKREILVVYGHHSSLERWWGLAQELNQYGSVTMPDLPGFGGMQSFYKIGEKPTIDSLADYLAAFIKLRYRRRPVTVVGLSFGFVVVTRMLQRYPDLARRVELVISVVGFAHRDDFTFSRPRQVMYRLGAGLFGRALPSIFFRSICLHPTLLRRVYPRTHNARQKFHKLRGQRRREALDFEIELWQRNDVRTHMLTTKQFLKLDNCKVPVDVPLWHIAIKNDRYFDNHVVEQHLRVIFSNFKKAVSRAKTHAPVRLDAATAAALIPPKLRTLLAA